MPVSIRAFTGKLNYDDHPFRVPQQDYIDALNFTRDSVGNQGGDGVVQNIIGSRLSAYTFQSGTQRTIGKYPDKVNNRMYYFVWNSNGYNSILYYDKGIDAIVKVFESKTDSGGVDILKWNPSFRINHIDIIYRDEGDLLFFTDGLNPPRKLNVLTATTGGYGIWKESYINVIKEPPKIPPAVVYENDNSVTVNNLRKKLFKIKYEFEYDDFEKSVTSSQSELGLPVNHLDVAIDKDPTKNSRIAIVVQTGTSRVKKIRISAAQSLGSVFSDFFLIKVVDKAIEGVADNDLFTYRFYNNQAYNYIPVQHSIQAFDWIPQKAYSQCLPNGNVLCYAAITEGYDLAAIAATSSVSTITQRTTQLPYLFVASQSGDSGFGTGNIHSIVLGSIMVGDVFNIYTSGATISFTATVATTANVITGLAAAATIAGFSVVSSDSENLIINKTNEVLQRIYSNPITRTITDSFVFDDSSRYEPALIYFDKEGRSGGAVIKSGISVQTSAYGKSGADRLINKISLSITSRPPIDAAYFHVLFSKNTTHSYLLEWVSDRTYKDSEFAYIGIENLTTFVNKNQQSPLGYEFTQGDRIRFMQVLSGSVNTIYTNNDFDIISEENNPLVNGEVRQGRFLKIVLPTITGTFDFGSGDFFNYFIKIYTPAQSVANGLDLYYEVPERYSIGNAGTINAFHQGMLQNQSSNLATPATFEFTKGDYYLRNRTVNTGGTLSFTIPSAPGGGHSSISTTVPSQFIERSFVDANLVTQPTQPIPFRTIGSGSGTTNFNTLNSAPASSDWWFLRVVSGSYTLQVKGVIKAYAINNEFAGYYALVVTNGSTAIPYTIVAPPIKWIAGQVVSFDFDKTIVLNSGEKLFMVFWGGQSGNYREFTQTDFEVTVLNPYTVPVIDPNFSDYFASAVNSYGRAWVNDPNSKKTYYPTLRRNGGEYQADTTNNNINRFYFDAQDSYNRSFGDIRKLFVNGSDMYVFQKFDIGVVPILRQVVIDVQGNPLQANSDILLNKIYYPYKGKIGIGDVPESFCHGKFAMYGCDDSKGIVWRLSSNGITVLSVLYKCNSFFIPKLAPFRKNLNNGIAATGQVYTGDPTVIGCYDSFSNKYIIAMQEISRYSDPTTLVFHQDAETISFLETRDTTEGFDTKYSYHPDSLDCLDNLLIAWKDGTAWTHDNTIFNNFFGVQYGTEVSAVFGNETTGKKTFETISETGSIKWDCPEISTSLMSYGSTPQQSNLKTSDLEEEEGEFNAPFLRDTNSINGINTGDVLKGKYIIIKLRAENASTFVFLDRVTVNYIESQLNKR